MLLSRFPSDVREVTIGENGILAGLHVLAYREIDCRKEVSW